MSQRGYCGIGVLNLKFGVNLGTLWRSAAAMDASFIFTVGRRYKKQHSDTTKSWRHIPLFEFESSDDLYSKLPYDAQLIGVELDTSAVSLPTFEHPERAVYLLGAEDHGLTDEALGRCHELVSIPSSHCLNVSTAGSIVLYDRMMKRGVVNRQNPHTYAELCYNSDTQIERPGGAANTPDPATEGTSSRAQQV